MGKKKSKPDPFQGPTLKDRQHLESLRQTFDVWQVDARQVAATVQGIRPWMIVVASRTEGLILGHELTQEPPTASQIWQTLFRAMTAPIAGEPHRPTEIQVRPHERFVPLRCVLDLGIDLTATRRLDQIDKVFQGLAGHLGRREPPGLLEMPGMTLEAVGRFFEAAATFYRLSPWKKAGETIIKVECAKFSSGPWYAVLMGQGGMARGLVLYDNMEMLKRIKQGNLTEEQNARLTAALTVVFGSKDHLSEADQEAVRQYGWKVASAKAYPSVYRKEPGLSMRPPLAWELELLEGCLRAIPEFLKKSRQSDPAKAEMAVLVASGELTLVLSWVVEAVAEDEQRDYLLDVVYEQWNNILYAYKQFEDRKPIVLYDIQEKRIYICEFEGYKSEMSPKSQAALTAQYEQALRENKIVVFVRDNEQRRLVSFSMDYE